MLQNPEEGQTVRVLEPFDQAFPDVYTIIEVVRHEDGQVACTLSHGIGDAQTNVGAFDPKFLTEAEV